MRYLTILLFFSTLFSMGLAQNSDAVVGKWANASGEAHVDVSKRNNKYYGKIVWLKNPKDEKGNTKYDTKNPEVSLRNKPLLGLEILKEFVFDGQKWTDGKIYDPKSGKVYSCNITLQDDGNLNIRGYIGISLIGRSEVWKKINQ
jgi:uncharacterized protein (DUF2147 family)